MKKWMSTVVDFETWFERFGFDRKRRRNIKNSWITFFAYTIAIVIIWSIALIPTWLGIGFWWLIGPTSDVARVILALGEIFVFGGFQILFAFIGVMATIAGFSD